MLEEIVKPRNRVSFSLKSVAFKLIEHSLDSASCSEILHDVSLEDFSDAIIAELAVLSIK